MIWLSIVLFDVIYIISLTYGFIDFTPDEIWSLKLSNWYSLRYKHLLKLIWHASSGQSIVTRDPLNFDAISLISFPHLTGRGNMLVRSHKITFIMPQNTFNINMRWPLSNSMWHCSYTTLMLFGIIIWSNWMSTIDLDIWLWTRIFHRTYSSMLEDCR